MSKPPSETVELPLSDGELVLRAQAGDRDAFFLLDGRYRTALVRYARRVGIQACDAEDIAQKTLLDAFTKLEQLAAPEAFLSWLYTIASRKIFDSRRQELYGTAEQFETLADERQGEPEQLASAVEQRQKLLHTASRVLTADQMEILLLRYDEGLKPKEIARRLGKRVVTIRVALYRARVKLLPLLEEPTES